MKFYDCVEAGLLGVEEIKSLKDYAGANRSGCFMAWLLRQSEPIACILLSIKFYPFIVTVYLRRGEGGDFGQPGLTDRRIFIVDAGWNDFCSFAIRKT